MTPKHALALGFSVNKIGLVWHGATEIEFRLKDKLINTKPHDLLIQFANTAFDNGVNYGKALKIIEIQTALKLPDNYSPF